MMRDVDMTINFKPYIDMMEELEEEEQVHLNHEDCPAGHDTKKRLYIKRTGDYNGRHNYIAYCQHCSSGGRYVSPLLAHKKPRQAVVATTANGRRRFVLPADFTGDARSWPAGARVWLYRYGITDAEIKHYGIGWSEERGRVVLPVYNDGKLALYQTRRIRKYDSKPKYLTYRNESRLFITRYNVDTCVITEDFLSAIKCGRLTNTAGCALLGASLQDKHILTLLSSFNKFIIFLDDDNSQVRRSQLKIKHKLELFASVRLISGDTHPGVDPKEMSDEDLEKLLC